MENFLQIDLNGLSSVEHKSSGEVCKEFFESFGNVEILDAEVFVDVLARKSQSGALIDILLKGSLTVPCDRCLEDLSVPVEEEVRLEARREGLAETAAEDGREIIFLHDDELTVDLSQAVYDYLCLSLPIQRCHAEGECNPAVMKYLDGAGSSDGIPENGAFAALASLFDNK